MKSAFRDKAFALVGVIAALLIGLSAVDGLVNEQRAPARSPGLGG